MERTLRTIWTFVGADHFVLPSEEQADMGRKAGWGCGGASYYKYTEVGRNARFLRVNFLPCQIPLAPPLIPLTSVFMLCDIDSGVQFFFFLSSLIQLCLFLSCLILIFFLSR